MRIRTIEYSWGIIYYLIIKCVLVRNIHITHMYNAYTYYIYCFNLYDGQEGTGEEFPIKIMLCSYAIHIHTIHTHESTVCVSIIMSLELLKQLE